MLVKVCGMKYPDNMTALGALPVDMMGMIFYPPSSRFLDDAATAAFVADPENLPGLRRVGVFVNAGIDEVLNRVHDYGLDYVQLHGTESPEYCAELLRIWSFSTARSAQLIKAFSVDRKFDFSDTAAYAPHCRYFVFDTKGEGFGGTGRQFDWGLLDAYRGRTPFLLSGGIAPDSAPAIRRLHHPQLAGVDINSRFEEEPGKKDIPAIAAFLQALDQR